MVLAAGALAEHVPIHATLSRRRLAMSGLALLLVAGLARSIDRMRVWKDNDAFFEQLMKDAPNGYRAHFLFARHVGQKSRLSQSEIEYRRAIRIFPYDAGMTLSIADSYTRAGLCEPAVTLFEWTSASSRSWARAATSTSIVSRSSADGRTRSVKPKRGCRSCLHVIFVSCGQESGGLRMRYARDANDDVACVPFYRKLPRMPQNPAAMMLGETSRVICKALLSSDLRNIQKMVRRLP